MSGTAVYIRQGGLYYLEGLKDWCHLNVGEVSKWRYVRDTVNRRYVFHFNDAADALAFKLRFNV